MRVHALDTAALRMLAGRIDAGKRLDTTSSIERSLHGHAAGNSVGPYKLRRCLGEGGNSSVWEAQHESHPGEPAVALKLPRIHDAVSRERFRRECQILARLRHQGIARWLGGGIPASGEPYLALAKVQGVSIVAYAQASGLGLDARLRLFGQVLQVVHYVHSQRIVHRDLKPSNILVEANGRVQLLDFGIAQFLDQPEDTVRLTQTGQQPCTLLYASPEQVAGRPVGLPTDIFSLGSVLYELLAGQAPHEAHAHDPLQLAWAIEHEAPACVVGLMPASWRRSDRGDVDAVVTKALQKAPDERYATVREFALDIDRLLRRKSVLARRPSPWGRACGWVRRERRSAAAVAAFLVCASVSATLVVRHVEQFYEARFQMQAAQAVQDVLREAFVAGSAGALLQMGSRSKAVRSLIERTGRGLESAFAASLPAKAQVMKVLLEISRSFGLKQPALDLARSYRLLAPRVHGDSTPEHAWALVNLARVAGDMGLRGESRGALDEAHAMLSRMHEIPVMLRGDLSLEEGLYASRFKPAASAESIEHYTRAAAAFEGLPPGEERAQALLLVGSALNREGAYGDAQPLIAEAMALASRQDNPANALLQPAQLQWAIALAGQGDLAGAEQAHREAAKSAIERFGADSHEAVEAAIGLGNFLRLVARHEESVEWLSLAVKGALSDSSNHAGTAVRACAYLARSLVAHGQAQAADAIASDAMRLRGPLGEQPSFDAFILETKADAEMLNGRWAQALALLDDAHRVEAGPSASWTDTAMSAAQVQRRVRALIALGRIQEAASVAGMWPEPPLWNTSESMQVEGLLLRARLALAQSQAPLTVELVSKVLARIDRAPARATLLVAQHDALVLQGQALGMMGHRRQSAASLQKALAISAQIHHASSPWAAQTAAALAHANGSQNKSR